METRIPLESQNLISWGDGAQSSASAEPKEGFWTKFKRITHLDSDNDRKGARPVPGTPSAVPVVGLFSCAVSGVAAVAHFAIGGDHIYEGRKRMKGAAKKSEDSSEQKAHKRSGKDRIREGFEHIGAATLSTGAIALDATRKILNLTAALAPAAGGVLSTIGGVFGIALAPVSALVLGLGMRYNWNKLNTLSDREKMRADVIKNIGQEGCKITGENVGRFEELSNYLKRRTFEQKVDQRISFAMSAVNMAAVGLGVAGIPLAFGGITGIGTIALGGTSFGLSVGGMGVGVGIKVGYALYRLYKRSGRIEKGDYCTEARARQIIQEDIAKELAKAKNANVAGETSDVTWQNVSTEKTYLQVLLEAAVSPSRRVEFEKGSEGKRPEGFDVQATAEKFLTDADFYLSRSFD